MMARSLCNVKLLSSLSENISQAINGRGFATAIIKGRAENMKQTSARKGAAKKEESWVPDPVTGHYRPENRNGETDVAELREMLLNNKKN